MPELPEVETVVQGLRPHMVGATIDKIIIHRPNLRYDFPNNLNEISQNARVTGIYRRSKYILIRLSTEWTIVSHLGMSGTYTIHNRGTNAPLKKHDHCVIYLTNGTYIAYNDPRRFGFLIACKTTEEHTQKHLSVLGVEPFADSLNSTYLYKAFQGRNTPIKTALLNQNIVAGLGNIYVCEALFKARIHPQTPAKNITKSKVTALTEHILQVIQDAICAGGSSLRDFQNTDGKMGYFQHNFAVYGRENELCNTCKKPIVRIQQSGRSTFFCIKCQKKP